MYPNVILNGKIIERNYLTYEELMNGGELVIKVSSTPNKNWGDKKSMDF